MGGPGLSRAGYHVWTRNPVAKLLGRCLATLRQFRVISWPNVFRSLLFRRRGQILRCAYCVCEVSRAPYGCLRASVFFRMELCGLRLGFRERKRITACILAMVPERLFPGRAERPELGGRRVTLLARAIADVFRGRRFAGLTETRCVYPCNVVLSFSLLLFTDRPAGRSGSYRGQRGARARREAALSEPAPAGEFAACPRPSDERPARA